MTPAQRDIQILRKYATGAGLLAIAADCGVGPTLVSEVVGAVNFQRGRAAEIVRQHDHGAFQQRVLNGRMTRPHPVPARQPRQTAPVSVIRWEDPPSSRSNGGGHSRGSHLAPLADELRSQPGRWALVHEGDSGGAATGMACHIRLGQVLAFTPAGGFDAVSRRVDGRHRVYAIYLGEDHTS